MPFYKQIKNEYGWIGIWKLTEKPEDLIQLVQLQPEDQNRFENMHSEKRKTEFLAARVLVKMALGADPLLKYNEFGKPFLSNNSKHLSISHSADFASVFISDQKNGIDIEQTERKIDRVATRFLHDEERSFISRLTHPQPAKIGYWSAKEAIFKCSDEHGIQFNNHIRIEGFEARDGHRFIGQLKLKDQTVYYNLYFHYLENNVLVYGVEL